MTLAGSPLQGLSVVGTLSSCPCSLRSFLDERVERITPGASASLCIPLNRGASARSSVVFVKRLLQQDGEVALLPSAGPLCGAGVSGVCQDEVDGDE
jgi:hypothetical protein